ncbi:MAG: alpha/beta hydrolase [Anaerolineales bacterium]|nr:alpha/beta hydrolase [Anaerolineales bacterium]
MQMKKLQLAAQSIAYYESSGTGQPMLLIHGNSASGRTFRHQLESDLGRTHRLVAIDLPGHGDSDPAPDTDAYGMPGYAAVIAAAATALGIPDAVLVGWSLGGHIALETHSHLPQAKGFVIYGTPPLAFPPDMENAFLPNPAVNVGFTAVVSEADALTYATSFFAPNADIDPAPFITDILRTDGNARVGLAGSIKPDGYQDEVEIVGNLKRPLAILHGAEEQLVSEPYISRLTMPTLWRGSVQIIPNAGHAPHWEQPQAFNDLLAVFLADC